MLVKIFLLFPVSLVVLNAYPQAFKKTIERHVQLSIQEKLLGNKISVKKINDNLYYIYASINYSVPVKEIDIPVLISLKNEQAVEDAKAAFHWLPNLKTAPDQIISQHVFRSPCILQCFSKRSVGLFPDLDLLSKNTIAPYFIDLEYKESGIVLHYGLADYETAGHVYYKKSGKPFSIIKPLQLGFYLMLANNNNVGSLLQSANQFLWNKWASHYLNSASPQVLSYTAYADTGYTMALCDYWVDDAGITLSTFYDSATKTYRGRDYVNDIWFHSWFNSIRTAYGLYAWGKKLNKPRWQQKSMATVKLFMSAPRNNGWIPAVYNSEKKEWAPSGEGGSGKFYHVPDLVWTAYWLMRFSKELKNIPGTDELLNMVAETLLKIQQPDGSFPARIDPATLKPDSILASSASSGICTWFLEEMMLQKKLSEKYRTAVLKSLEFLSRDILPKRKFEDFEVYFSCSKKPSYNWYDSATASYPENTLCIQWCAEAYLNGYKLFKDKKCLDKGKYCLNILSLYQQVWNPPFINFYAFGGFGAQNSDAEWSDARQAQFAETYLNYYHVTNNKEYLQRAIAACRASFALMVIPGNFKTTFPSTASGNMPENYGHSGYNRPSGQSGFHWGTGSALTTAILFEKN
jgi:hypothetical protein